MLSPSSLSGGRKYTKRIRFKDDEDSDYTSNSKTKRKKRPVEALQAKAPIAQLSVNQAGEAGKAAAHRPKNRTRTREYLCANSGKPGVVHRGHRTARVRCYPHRPGALAYGHRREDAHGA
jgi:hypothetical protein